MVNSPDFIARAPRHEALDAEDVTVQIQRPLYDNQILQPCRLMNASRQGCQISASAPLGKYERVVVRIGLAERPPMLEVSAVVRWQAQEECGDRWLLGCQFDELISWETLGELFLSNVLANESFA